MDRMWLLMQPVSKSDLHCVTCGHLFDESIRVCTCVDPKDVLEGDESGRKPIRRVVKFKDYLKEKYGGK